MVVMKQLELPIAYTSDIDFLSIAKAADVLSVSEASVRNWIKTGYLQQAPSGLIERSSFDRFVNNVVGNDKLTSRANKSRSDSHDHSKLVHDVLTQLAEATASPDAVASNYEKRLSSSYRNKEGVYYTPPWICDDLLSQIMPINNDAKFCDPCCGSGNFLLAAYRAGLKPENIFGFDVDPVAVEIAKRRFADATGFSPINIVCCDYLDDLAEGRVAYGNRFDIIFTNPPWGKKIPKAKKDFYRDVFKTGRSVDTSAIFFFAALADLIDGGRLGLLLPESFFSISQFQSAREELLKKHIEILRDYDKPFKGLLTKARAFVLRKTIADNNHKVTCLHNGSKTIRPQTSFQNNPGKIINFSISFCDADVIERVFGAPHTTLNGSARWGLGIVTGNNKKFCKTANAPGLMPVYKGSEIHPDRLEGPSNFIPCDITLYQQVAPRDLFEAPEKVIYRFISSKLIFHCDNTRAYILNSANLFVVNPSFPVSMDKIVKLFNLPIYTWIFQKVFDTHKILRSDIECLPIFTDFLNEYDEVTEDALLAYLCIERGEDGTYRIKT